MKPHFPYTLHRPLFGFLRTLTSVWLIASLVAALLIPSGLIGGLQGFLTVLLVGSALWLGVALSVFCSRQSLTLFDDRLELRSFGNNYTLRFSDIRDIDLRLTTTTRTIMLSLWLEPDEAQPPWPEVNLMLFSVSDRALLMNTLAAHRPDLILNEVAQQVQAGKRFW